MSRKHKKDRAITDAARAATPFGLLRRTGEGEVTAEDLVGRQLKLRNMRSLMDILDRPKGRCFLLSF